MIDVAKGIAIILVLIGHSIQYASGASYSSSGAFYDNWVFKIIYSFHMPLFMIISGYLFNNSIGRKTTKAILIDKLRTLLLPIFAFAFVAFWVRYDSGLCLIDQIRRYFSFTRYTLWFLWALFYSSIGVTLIHKFFKDNIFVYILVFAVSICLPDKYYFELYKFMFPCFVVGYFAGKNRWLDYIKKHSKIIAIITLFLFVAMLQFYNTECYVYMSGSYLFGSTTPLRQLGVDVFRVIVGVVGSVVVISLLMNIYTKKRNDGITKTLCFFGKNTMGIYCIQNYFWILFPGIVSGVIRPIFVNRLIVFLVCLALSCVITLLLKKMRVLNFVFLGGR